MENNCKAEESLVGTPAVCLATQSNNKSRRTKRRHWPRQRAKKQQQQLSNSSVSELKQQQQSNSQPIPTKLVAGTQPLPRQQIKQRGPTANEIKSIAGCQGNSGKIDSLGRKGGSGSGCGSGNCSSGNSNKGKGPINITNTNTTGLGINDNNSNKPQEPSKRNIILYTNRARLAAQAELLAEAVPFRLPYNSA